MSNPATQIVTPGAASADREGMILVQLPSGANFPVHEEEVDYFVERCDLYLKQNHFVNISDLQDVDRMMILELFVYRWGTWLSRQTDWWGDTVDANETQKAIKEWSNELRQLKKLVGIDKTTRDKQRGDDSVSAYLANLQQRGNEFGVMRENQLSKALELFNQLKALITLHDNLDEVEIREMHVSSEDVLEWMREVAIPEYDAIDEYFMTHQQKSWIRSM